MRNFKLVKSLILLVLFLGLLGVNQDRMIANTTITPFNEKISAELNRDEKVNYYIIIPKSGYFEYSITSTMNQPRINIYDNFNEEISSEYLFNDESFPQNFHEKIALEQGTYRIELDNSYSSNGTYSLEFNFIDAASTEDEPNNGNAIAQKINLDEKINGFLAVNDNKDYFEFTLPEAGKFSFKLTSFINDSIKWAIVNDLNETLRDDTLYSSEVNPGEVHNSFNLSAGKYYLVLSESYNDSGHYSFTTSFEAGKSNESEPNNGNVQANFLDFGFKVNGFLEINNHIDYFKFKVPSAGDINLKVESNVDSSLNIEIFDQNNKKVFDDYIYSSELNSGIMVQKKNLATGNYFIKISTSEYNDGGKYSFNLSGHGITKFKDFNCDLYWSEPFIWGMNNNVVKGDTTKMLLNPNNNLTEAQWLAVILRYAVPYEAADSVIKPWYSTYYSLAKKYNVHNLNKPNDGIRRGDVAVIMAETFTGKDLTERQAVQWLFDNEITTGVDPNKPKTYENFESNGLLRRSHSVTFLHRAELKGLEVNIK